MGSSSLSYQSASLAMQCAAPSSLAARAQPLCTCHSRHRSMLPRGGGGDPATPPPKGHAWLFSPNSPDGVTGTSHLPASLLHPSCEGWQVFAREQVRFRALERRGPPGRLTPRTWSSAGLCSRQSRARLTGRMLHARLPPHFLLAIFPCPEII